MEYAPIRHTVTVSGTGSVLTEPDTARLALGVIATADTLQDASATVSSAMAAVLEALQGQEVAKRDITTSQLRISPVAKYDDTHTYIGISGYEVSTHLTVIVRALDQVGTLLEAAVTNGANSVHSIDFFVADPAPAAREARALAVADAQDRADQIAGAAGLTVTGVYAISETSAPTPAAQEFGAPRMKMLSSAAAAIPVSPGSTETAVWIEAVFEVAPFS